MHHWIVNCWIVYHELAQPFATGEKVACLHKWLSIHPSTTDINLYSPISFCSLPIKSLTDTLKSSKISGHLFLQDSKDPTVASVSPKIKSGRWNEDSSCSIPEAEL